MHDFENMGRDTHFQTAYHIRLCQSIVHVTTLKLSHASHQVFDISKFEQRTKLLVTSNQIDIFVDWIAGVIEQFLISLKCDVDKTSEQNWSGDHSFQSIGGHQFVDRKL